MAVYKVRNSTDARSLAATFGLRIPESKRGRFPLNVLAARLDRYGHELDLSEYDKSAKPNPVYVVSAWVQVGKGKAMHMERLTSEIDLATVRELSGTVGTRGRPGAAVIDAIESREGWVIPDRRQVDIITRTNGIS